MSSISKKPRKAAVSTMAAAEATIRTVFDAHQRLCDALDAIDPGADGPRVIAGRVLLAYIEHAKEVRAASPIPRHAEKALIDLVQSLADLEHGAATSLVKPSAPAKNPADPKVRERRWLVRACIEYLTKRDRSKQHDAVTCLLDQMGSGAEEQEREVIQADLRRVRSQSFAPSLQIADDSELAQAVISLKALYAR